MYPGGPGGVQGRSPGRRGSALRSAVLHSFVTRTLPGGGSSLRVRCNQDRERDEMASPRTDSISGEPRQPLTPLQLELLKLYSTGISEGELLELKRELARYFASKAIAAADRVWQERLLSERDMDAWLDE